MKIIGQPSKNTIIMKNKTASEIEKLIWYIGFLDYSGNGQHNDTKSKRIEMIKQYAKDAQNHMRASCYTDLRRLQKEGLKVTQSILDSVLNAKKPELL